MTPTKKAAPEKFGGKQAPPFGKKSDKSAEERPPKTTKVAKKAK